MATACVTGASTGLGLETARSLAADGMHVVLAVRDPARGESACAPIDGSTEVAVLDLASLASVCARSPPTSANATTASTCSSTTRA